MSQESAWFAGPQTTCSFRYTTVATLSGPRWKGSSPCGLPSRIVWRELLNQPISAKPLEPSGP